MPALKSRLLEGSRAGICSDESGWTAGSSSRCRDVVKLLAGGNARCSGFARAAGKWGARGWVGRWAALAQGSASWRAARAANSTPSVHFSGKLLAEDALAADRALGKHYNSSNEIRRGEYYCHPQVGDDSTRPADREPG